ncbi:MAG TPA: putative toxin-antitoxin system toxin component, PIN family [Thermoanaerobaculia bacterium]|nr:putative toxin-antitoxin system toxin component, PIN family [Thermoanaerobaculia bacterium]
MRLVLDTNVLIAAFVARGTCHELLEHCERHHHLIGSEHILQEFEDKLLTKFKVPPPRAAETVALLRSRLEIFEPAALSDPVCRDSDDDWILATALAGGCACIVTGDGDLLVLEEYKGIRILAPAAFWSYESRTQSPA